MVANMLPSFSKPKMISDAAGFGQGEAGPTGKKATRIPTGTQTGVLFVRLRGVLRFRMSPPNLPLLEYNMDVFTLFGHCEQKPRNLCGWSLCSQHATAKHTFLNACKPEQHGQPELQEAHEISVGMMYRKHHQNSL
jgi:hypothetical protein